MWFLVVVVGVAAVVAVVAAAVGVSRAGPHKPSYWLCFANFESLRDKTLQILLFFIVFRVGGQKPWYLPSGKLT